MKKFSPILALLASVVLLSGKQEQRSCASHADKAREELQLHLQSDSGLRKRKLTSAGKAAVTLLPDIGNIAHLDAADGVVARRNPFNLNGKTIRFVPSDGSQKYRYEVGEGSYEAAAAENGAPVLGLGDDDSREFALLFPFPFFGAQHRSLHLNSDGNVSFGTGDVEITDRSLGRMQAGPPRIAPLFRDLDPSQPQSSVRILNEANRVVISWVETPEYRDLGNGPRQTFQLRLYSDGRIEFAYISVNTTEAVTGIAPGGVKGEPTLVTFLNGNSPGEYNAAIVERFSGSESIDIFSAAQKFYRNHEDSYDFLVIYNNLGIEADVSAVAYEVTVRNQRSGYGDSKTSIGEQAGSPARLQALLNMGPLDQYPRDPGAKVPARQSVGDTPLSTIAHETGHLFLAYASVRDEFGDTPMVGHQGAHWDFKFNSEASLLEGNRIQDNGPAASPRFLTTGTVEGFSALDQYLMGLRAAEGVPDTFYVANARGLSSSTILPKVGVAFDGERRDVNIRQIINAEGRRTPDHTVSQRKFRFAFLLITAEGKTPTAEELAQIESYRDQFVPYFQKATGQNATADTSIRRSVKASSFPAVGVLTGATAPVVVTLEQAPTAALNFSIRTTSGAVRAPQSVMIPAGQRSVTFDIRGATEGTDDLVIEPADPTYETVASRVQVLPASRLKLDVLSEASPVRVKVMDENELPYPGVVVQARATGGGSVDRPSGVADANGVVEFTWTQPTDTASQFLASVGSGPSVTISAAARPAFLPTSVLNAASFVAGVVPGGIASIFGSNLGGTNAQVFVNGRPAPVLFANAGQVNFLVPSEAPTGSAQITIQAGNATSSMALVPVLSVQPGLFFDAASGLGAVTVAGTGQLTTVLPAKAGQYVEVYATALGGVRSGMGGLFETVVRPDVTIAGLPADVAFSGLAPGYVGLYQLNVRVPDTAPNGLQPLVVTSGGVRSNEVRVRLE